MAKPKTAITPTREENYPEWYQQVIKAAELAEPSPVRGCMVIKPWGYGIWEHIQQRSSTGASRKPATQNAYFPLLIPLSYPREGSRARRGFRHRVRGGHPPPARDGQG
jgi:prolyl-tRNA synthetase